MCNANRNRRPPQPVQVTHRWHRRLWHNAEDLKSGLLEISTDTGSKVYGVVALMDQGRVVGYELIQPDGTTYHIDAETWACDCPDATHRPDRPGGCRHTAGLREALASPVE